MTNEALLLLNKLIKLSLVDDSINDQNVAAYSHGNANNLAQDWTSKRC